MTIKWDNAASPRVLFIHCWEPTGTPWELTGWIDQWTEQVEHHTQTSGMSTVPCCVNLDAWGNKTPIIKDRSLLYWVFTIYPFGDTIIFIYSYAAEVSLCIPSRNSFGWKRQWAYDLFLPKSFQELCNIYYILEIFLRYLPGPPTSGQLSTTV